MFSAVVPWLLRVLRGGRGKVVGGRMPSGGLNERFAARLVVGRFHRGFGALAFHGLEGCSSVLIFGKSSALISVQRSALSWSVAGSSLQGAC